MGFADIVDSLLQVDGFSLISGTYCLDTKLILQGYVRYAVAMHFPYISNTVSILSPYSPHTVLILFPYRNHTEMIRKPYGNHTAGIRKWYIFFEFDISQNLEESPTFFHKVYPAWGK